jgi:pilus assembly protein FimV
VLKSLLKAVGLLAILAWSGFAFAVGMGSINVTSALGRPLKAEIALVALDNADKASITVKLASPSEFKNAGIDYPYALPKLSFEIETRANGEPYVKLTSTQPVNEPFVSLLLELSWSSGRLLREYTFLLDPEGFVAEQPKMAEVQPVEPVAPVAGASAVPAEAAPAATEPAAAEPAAALVPVPVLATAPEPEHAAAPAPVESGMEGAAMAAASAPAAAQPDVTPDMEAKDLAAESAVTEAKGEPAVPAEEKMASAEPISVKRGDTLGRIAAQTKPADISLERMVVALYHANNKEFDGKNMNRLRAGKILRMPESEDISKVTQTAAVKEIRAHVADWHAYRQKLAAAQGVVTEQAAKQADAGKVTAAAVADKVPAAKEQAKEVLKLSKGEAPGDKQGAAGGASKQEKHIAKADDALAKEKQLQEEQKRAAELEKIRKEGSKLVELKTQAAESKPAATPAPAASAVAAAQPSAVKPKIVAPPPVAAPSSPLDDMLNDPIYLGGAVAVLLGLGGLGFVLVRRLRSKGGKKKSEVKKEFKIEPIGSATGSWVAPVPPSPETGDFTQAVPTMQPAATAAVTDDVDPIGEAELFLNFGRDAQAEEVLKEALIKNPSNIPVKLKLLSIYTNRKDATSFSKYAREIQQSGDTAAWEQAAAMGRTVDPSNPTYGGGPGAQPEVAVAETAAVDFDLGFGKPAAAAAPAKEFSMDFDVTGTHPGIAGKSSDNAGGVVDVSGILPGEVARAAQETPMDFDVSGILPGEVMKAAQKSEMDFDISSTQILKAPSVAAMDFDVTGSGTELKAPEAPAAAPALNFGDLIFEMPTSEPKAAEPAKPAPAADEGMPFSIDFSLGEAEAPALKADTASKLDIDFADISLNLDTAASPAGGDAKSEQWHEVATKLDLAKAYQEMGDAAGAREILDEVVRDGDEQQREAAGKLLQQLSA